MVDTFGVAAGAGPVYHYQSKLTAKEPEVGGALGMAPRLRLPGTYNGCIRPEPACRSWSHSTRPRAGETACLQIATGLAQARPHRPHAIVADPERGRSQAHALHPRAVPDRVLRARGRRDALIFHCNAIHRSDATARPTGAGTLLICYKPRRQRHDHQDRRSILRAARDGRRWRACAAPGLRFASGGQRRALRVTAVRAGFAPGRLVLGAPRTPGRRVPCLHQRRIAPTESGALPN